jgi:hypothetical protein
VHVSIAAWKKGHYAETKELYIQEKKQLYRNERSFINSSLSLNVDVSSAEVLECNRKPKKVFQGQTHGHEGFLLSKAEGIKLLRKHPNYKDVLNPFLIGEELVGNYNSQPSRFVIDFTLKNVFEASAYKEIFKVIETRVLPTREAAAKEQEEENKKALEHNSKAKVNKHHINFLKSWWKLGYGREDMLEQKNNLERYIACARVTQRPIFEFFSSEINPNDKLMAFMFEDDYSFGIIQSNIHWQWFMANCTTLGETPNYNTASIWDTFPWPQNPSEKQVKKVADAAREFHLQRTKAMQQYHYSLRDLYRIIEQPGKNPIKDLQLCLDKAVIEAYGFDTKGKTADTNFILENLLQLNLEVSAKEKKGEAVTPPGLPSYIKNKEDYVTDDCVKFELE